MKKLVLAAAIAAMGMNTANAEDVYYGVGLTQLNWEFDYDFGLALEDSSQALQFYLGKRLSPNLAVEGSVMTSLNDASDAFALNVEGQNVNLSLDISVTTGVSASVLGILPMNNQLELYGRLGIAAYRLKSTLKIANQTQSYTDNDEDLIFGLGLNYSLNDRSALRAEYTYFYDDLWNGVDTSVTGFTLAFQSKF